MSPGPEGTAAFLTALARYKAIPAERIALEERLYNELSGRLLDEVRRVKPKAKVPRWESKVGDPYFVSTFYGEVSRWAAAHLDVDAFVGPLAKPAQEEHERLGAERETLGERLAELAPFAVFPVTPGARIVAHRDTDHRSQPHPGFYQRASCDLRAAVLAARGFHPVVEAIPHGSQVVVDGPPELADVLRFWRLDDVRLLATVGAANLKVLFHPMFPYAGYWDWPEKHREKRDDPSFAKHRANEDAHLALNAQPSLPPPPLTPPPAV